MELGEQIGQEESARVRSEASHVKLNTVGEPFVPHIQTYWDCSGETCDFSCVENATLLSLADLPELTH